jgi:hypothetical protein
MLFYKESTIGTASSISILVLSISIPAVSAGAVSGSGSVTVVAWLSGVLLQPAIRKAAKAKAHTKRCFFIKSGLSNANEAGVVDAAVEQ